MDSDRASTFSTFSVSNARQFSEEASSNAGEHYCGPLTGTCTFCRAVFFTDEKTGPEGNKRFFKCCKGGKVVLPIDCVQTRYPELLKRLLTGEDREARNFRANIRNYNTTFACASVRSNIVSRQGRGPYCFRIQGQMYHQVGNLEPPQDRQATYGQLYFLDTTSAMQSRLGHPANVNLIEGLLIEIHNLLSRENPLIRSFFTTAEVLRNQEREDPNAPVNVEFQFLRTNNRREAAPNEDAVVAIFDGADGLPPSDIEFSAFKRVVVNR